MNRKSLITILTILIVPVVTFFGLTFTKESPVEAQGGNLPQVIKFSSTMCSECKQVEKIFDEILPEHGNKFIYKEVIVDSRKDMDNDLIRKYNVTLVPTVIMLNSNGTEAKRIEGAVTKHEYIKSINGLK